jgi:hypothetical protein
MSSAINHKKRSRRGYQQQRKIMAPAHSPLIAADKYAQRKRFREFVKRLKLERKNRQKKAS